MLTSVAVALDTSDWKEFEEWSAFFGPRVGTLKVGLEAYVRWGPRAVETAKRHAQNLFLDLKLHDIPNTVAGAAGSAASLGVDLLTVHAGGGGRMIEAAAAAGGRHLGVLAVTVLTHLDEQELDQLAMPGSISGRVGDWAKLAIDHGAVGVVCSPLELGGLRPRLGSQPLLVTPGIRLGRSGHDDQRRITTPGQAAKDGSSLLVIGRPLTRAADRERALDEVAASLAGASVG